MLLKLENLEKTLIANWTNFLDVRKLTSYIMKIVKTHNFEILQQEKIPQKSGLQLKVSKFQPKNKGFLVWIEFRFSENPKEITIGTIELFLYISGKVKESQIIGTTLKKE